MEILCALSLDSARGTLDPALDYCPTLLHGFWSNCVIILVLMGIHATALSWTPQGQGVNFKCWNFQLFKWCKAQVITSVTWKVKIVLAFQWFTVNTCMQHTPFYKVLIKQPRNPGFNVAINLSPIISVFKIRHLQYLYKHNFIILRPIQWQSESD